LDYELRYELPDLRPSNSHDLNPVHYKIWGMSLPDKSAGCDWFEAASDWCVSWSGTVCCWLWHWPVVHTSPCLHLSHRRAFWTFTVIQISQNIVTVINYVSFIVIRHAFQIVASFLTFAFHE